MFHAAEARGHALLGDARTFATVAGLALDAMDRSEPDQDPPWIAHFDHAYLADELAHCHRDLGQAEPAARRAEEALAAHPATRARRRAIDLLLLADTQVQQRELDAACQTGEEAVVLLSGLRSNRGAEYLDDFRRRLEPFAGEPVVRAFHARLDEREAA